MPPSQRRTSSRFAHKESDEIAANQNYELGEYSFRVERSSGTSPNYDKIEAICTKNGKNARKSIQVPSTYKYDGYYVEANGDTADVYAIIRKPDGGGGKSSGLDTGNIPQPISSLGSITSIITREVEGEETSEIIVSLSGSNFVSYSSVYDGRNCKVLVCGPADSTYTYTIEYPDRTVVTENQFHNFVTIDEKTVGYGITGIGGISSTSIKYSVLDILYPDVKTLDHTENVAWTVVYGTPSGSYGEPETVLIGRFAIELEEAGGAGESGEIGGWSDPGDYDYIDYPDPEERDPDDPTYTLNVEVVGALSGRHNDPLEDTSYSYIPSDKATIKDYGCGGDGGNGGGGGAGASSIVVYKFATSRADGKEITAIAKRHGYGSGGGKGGKGGDGCILVYY